MKADTVRKNVRRSVLKAQGVKRIELSMPAAHVERLDALAKAAGITRAQAVSMLLLDKGESE